MERVHRWFGWHPRFAIVIAGMLGVSFAAVAASELPQPHAVAVLIITGLLLSPFIVFPLLWVWRGVRMINGNAAARLNDAIAKIVSQAGDRLGGHVHNDRAHVLWLGQGRAPLIACSTDYEVTVLFVEDRVLAVCDGARFDLRSGRWTPCSGTREILYEHISSVGASGTTLMIELASRHMLRYLSAAKLDDVLRAIRERMEALPPPPPSPQASAPADPQLRVVITSGEAAHVQREVIERQIIVMRCKYCNELIPVDMSRCKHCGAGLTA